MLMSNNEISVIKKYFCLILIFVFLWAVLTSCVPQSATTEIVENPKKTPGPMPTPTATPVLSNWEESIIEEGQYGRTEYCPVSFSYQSRSSGLLTVAVSNNISEIWSVEEVYGKIFNRYIQLQEESPVDLTQTAMVIVLPEGTIDDCSSYNDVVFTSAEMIDSNMLLEDIIGASTGIKDHWVRAGLAFVASGAEIDREALIDWYAGTEDLDILGFFTARFMTDWVSQEEVDIARMTAASVVKYCIEYENIPVELIGKKINNTLRNQWLNFIGVERSVEYAYDGLYEPFNFLETEGCSLMLKSEKINFCLNKLTYTPFFDEVHDAEDLIYRATTGYKALTDYLLENAPSVKALTDSNESITIEVKKLDVMLGYTQGNTISIHNSAVLFDVIHEIVHTYDWNEKLYYGDMNILFSEGFAEYLGKLLPIYEQPGKIAIWQDINGEELSPGISFWYCLDEEQLASAKEWYLSQGGSLQDQESINPRLFTDAIAFATIYRNAYDGPLGISIEEKYTRLFGRSFSTRDFDGLELSYTQAASFVGWLCDTYTVDVVMEKYVNHDENTALEGMEYETLKQAWLADLKIRGKGIPIPDSP
jgi:hypothetical protein